MFTECRDWLLIDFNDNAAIVPLLDTSPRNMNLAVGCDDVPAGFDPGSVAASSHWAPTTASKRCGGLFVPTELPLGNFTPWSR